MHKWCELKLRSVYITGLLGPQEKFESTIISQLAIFVTSLAAVEAARRTNPVVVEKWYVLWEFLIVYYYYW